MVWWWGDWVPPESPKLANRPRRDRSKNKAQRKARKRNR